MTKDIIRHPDEDALKEDIATRAIKELAAVQAKGDEPHFVLTGGTIGIAALEAIANHKAVKDVDWQKVHFWWGDERFVAADSADRNALQAYDALLSHIEIDQEKVYEFPATDDFENLDAAVAAFNKQISENFSEPVAFDLVFLGMGPDSHVASLFPGKANLKVNEITTLPEKDSPKPPPERLTMSMPMINNAKKVWLLVSGEGKTEAVKESLSDKATIETNPASAAAGTEETLWLVDEAAVSQLES
ncbi:MAG: 6-phosphogluconolactonase [Micrococcaceae bacterium]